MASLQDEHVHNTSAASEEDILIPAVGSVRDTSSESKDGRSLWTLLLLLILTNMAMSLYNLPLNRVIELRLCREYYFQRDPSVIGPGGSIPEELCKLNQVQQQLAWLQGIMETTVIVCGELNIATLKYLVHRS